VKLFTSFPGEFFSKESGSFPTLNLQICGYTELRHATIVRSSPFFNFFRNFAHENPKKMVIKEPIAARLVADWEPMAINKNQIKLRNSHS
jgi:hypothetical protein